MNRADFSISIRFHDGTTIDIGGDDTLFVTKTDDDRNAIAEAADLDDARLNLARLVREAEIAATEAA